MSSTSPRIERGAALLDLAAPGWEKRIDLFTLDLSSDRYCIVGQLYGSYNEGIAVIDGEAERTPIRFGFIAQANEAYYALTDKWRAAITRRLERKRAA